MSGTVTRMEVPGNKPGVFTGLAIGGPLDGNVISHPQRTFTVAKMGPMGPLGQVPRMLDQSEVDQMRVETVSYIYYVLLAHPTPFGLFLTTDLQQEHPTDYPLVIGIRELVKRYSDTTPNKAIPAGQHEKRRH